MSENQALTKPVYSIEDIQKGGLGRSSTLFQVNPDVIQLMQPTNTSGGTAGKLRIKSTGIEFDKMQVVLLFDPVERRSYFEGDGVNFSKDNLVCYSLDNVQPHANARIQQAFHCASCAKADWSAYRQSHNLKDMPKCQNYWHCLVIDRATKLPYYIDVKGASIPGFKSAMQHMARMMAYQEAVNKTRKANVFEYSFVVSGEHVPKSPRFVLKFDGFAPIAEADQAEFGQFFLDFMNRGVQQAQEREQAEAAAAVEQAQTAINATVVEGNGPAVEGEYIQI